MDLRLPDGCGLSIVEALKRRRPDVRIVIQNGMRQYPYRSQRGEAGANSTKPADRDEIACQFCLRTLQRVLGKGAPR
jgi:ActR/RegA family two-component response regulator